MDGAAQTLPHGQLATTNLSLIAQLHGAGCSPDTIRAVQQHYRLAAELTAGMHRANWKPFICHLTGVASGVAFDSNDPDLIGAALLHSALEYGRFPMFHRSAEARIRHVSKRANAAIGDLVRRYHQSSRGGIAFDEKPSPEMVPIIHLRLADLLDDMTDNNGLLVTDKDSLGLRGVRDMSQPAALARSIGAPNLAAALETVAARPVHEPVVTEPGAASFSLTGRGWRRRLRRRYR